MLSTLLIISCLVSVWASNWWQIDVHYNMEVVPNNVHIFENSSVTFYCGSETPEYWMYSGENLDTPGHDIPIRQNHVLVRRQLTLQNVRLNDSGLYVCQGNYGNTTFFTTHFSIKVYNTTIPKTLVVPNWVEIEAGGSITLLCGSDGPVEWFSPHIMHQDKVVGDKTLTLLNLQRNHSGKYICRGVQFYELDESGSDDNSSEDEYDKGHNDRIIDVFYTPTTVLMDREVNRVKNEIGLDKAIERIMIRVLKEEDWSLAF